ncbi:peroxiredoxin family protein [Tautonia plasticadhaerens]|uniref:Uncharacterized protein n=1 Tax=Tautonia plasticadhaerens TaxID=2527974 RepID=A0A518GVC8_9BACT|nr:redoxin domain-containing protein [Tautonia plasticadhaerens]QDV32549.1 hypothetical protein ElP_03830 [Tautonia plasticadhaerens]
MRIWTLAMTFLGMVLGTSTSARADDVRVGRRHPDFTLPRIDGRSPVSLSDLRGKKVLLIQFASW